APHSGAATGRRRGRPGRGGEPLAGAGRRRCSPAQPRRVERMTEPLSPQYDPAGIERQLYARWRAEHRFHQPAEAAGERYVIQMPPPNVTAVLHAGHGLTYTVQDVLIRFQRMRGRKAVWVPGTDHAGIATQNVVEKILAQQGQTRFDLGRDAF